MVCNPEASVFIGNLDARVTERVLYEVMVQAGPLVSVYIPRDKVSQKQSSYGFAEYTSRESAQYAVTLFSGLVRLYNRTLIFSVSGSSLLPPPPQTQLDQSWTETQAHTFPTAANQEAGNVPVWNISGQQQDGSNWPNAQMELQQQTSQIYQTSTLFGPPAAADGLQYGEAAMLEVAGNPDQQVFYQQASVHAAAPVQWQHGYPMGPDAYSLSPHTPQASYNPPELPDQQVFYQQASVHSAAPVQWQHVYPTGPDVHSLSQHTPQASYNSPQLPGTQYWSYPVAG